MLTGRWPDASRSCSATSRSRWSTRSSTPPTSRCSAEAASTGPSTAPAGRRSSAECRAAGRVRDRGREGDDGGAPAGALRRPHGRPGLARRRAAASRRCWPRATAARSSSRPALGCRTVAFPAISTGVYGYPVEQAAQVAIASDARGAQGAAGHRARALRALRRDGRGRLRRAARLRAPDGLGDRPHVLGRRAAAAADDARAGRDVVARGLASCSGVTS